MDQKLQIRQQQVRKFKLTNTKQTSSYEWNNRQESISYINTELVPITTLSQRPSDIIYVIQFHGSSSTGIKNIRLITNLANTYGMVTGVSTGPLCCERELLIEAHGLLLPFQLGTLGKRIYTSFQFSSHLGT